MRHPESAAVPAGIGLILTLAAACATGRPAPESEPPDSGDCAFEVRNEANVALSIMAGGSRIRQLGSLEPGQSLRFQDSCEVDEVLITATSAQTGEPSLGPGPGRTRDRVIQRTVAPWPDHVVRVSLRFPEQIRPGGGGFGGCSTLPDVRDGPDSPLPPGAARPDPPAPPPERPRGA